MAGNDNVFAAILSGIGVVNQAYQQNQQNQLANKELSFRERESAANRAAQQEQFDKTFQQQAEQWNKTYRLESDKLDMQKTDWATGQEVLQNQFADISADTEGSISEIMKNPNSEYAKQLSTLNTTPIKGQYGTITYDPKVKGVINAWKTKMTTDAQNNYLNKMISANGLNGISMGDIELAIAKAVNKTPTETTTAKTATTNTGVTVQPYLKITSYDEQEKRARELINEFKSTGDQGKLYQAKNLINTLVLRNPKAEGMYDQEITDAMQSRMSPVGYGLSNAWGAVKHVASGVPTAGKAIWSIPAPLFKSEDDLKREKEEADRRYKTGFMSGSYQMPGALKWGVKK